MKSLFASTSPLMRFLTMAANLMILNLIWIACSVPIVTIGASTTALYTVINVFLQDGIDNADVIKPFFRCFRKDFLKSEALFAITLVITLVAAANAFAAQHLSRVVGVLALIPLLVILIAINYVFPLHAKFENSCMNTIKNAVLLGLLNFPRSILLICINLMPLIILVLSESLFWHTFIFWLLIGFALSAYFSTKTVSPIFKQLVEKTGSE